MNETNPLNPSNPNANNALPLPGEGAAPNAPLLINENAANAGAAEPGQMSATAIITKAGLVIGGLSGLGAFIYLMSMTPYSFFSDDQLTALILIVTLSAIGAIPSIAIGSGIGGGIGYGIGRTIDAAENCRIRPNR